MYSTNNTEIAATEKKRFRQELMSIIILYWIGHILRRNCLLQ